MIIQAGRIIQRRFSALKCRWVRCFSGQRATGTNLMYQDRDAQVISNVGRDQYNAHVQQVIQQRDSFMRDIAATKTKARWLVWLGPLFFVAGFALFGAADLDFIRQVSSDIQTGSSAPPSNILGHPIAGVPSGLIGAGLAFIGMIMLLIGILLHIVAASRRRRVERELPLPPPPWQQYGPPGRAG